MAKFLIVKNLLYNIKKYLCYSDISGKGIKGEWHCRKCNPCDGGLFK